MSLASDVSGVIADRTPSLPGTLATLLAPHVAARARAVAVVGRDVEFSFGELDRLSDGIAASLAARGIERGDLVAVALERSPESVALLFGIAKAGAAFVPVDPFAPERRLREVLADARPAMFIAAQRYVALLDDVGCSAHAIEAIVAAAARATTFESVAPPAPDDLAYVIYTSGSTGTPKGVMVEHRAVLHTLRASAATFGYRPDDRVYQLAAWTFDPAMLQIFGALGAGARLVLNATDELDFGALAADLVERGVTIFDTVPAVLGPLLDEPRLAASQLRIVGCGGAVMRGSLRDRCFARLGVALCNHYGPTETAILATAYRTSPSETDERVPIGFPLPGVRTYLLDEAGVPVEPGARGELYIGGPGVGRGYLNRPELTTARFLADPFAPEAGARMYRTGDFVRERADGALEFDGRIDRQVKVRGVRVELEEVEHAIARHDRVGQAVVIVQGEEGNERLSAFVTARGTPEGLVDELVGYVREQLPPALRPARIAVVDALPALASGKIDVTALAASAQAPAGDVTVAGGTLIDAIARIWRDVLGHAEFGLDDDFFAIGGNSLAAARCAARIAAHFGRRIPIAVLFAEATVAGIAAVVRSNERLGLAPIVQIAGGTKIPLFFMHGDYTGVGLYVRQFAGNLDAGRPIYALPPHGADGGPVPATLGAMAADHLREIRLIQPHGPYILGGYCMGAMVAIEVARALEADGEHVAHVVAIDAHLISPRTPLRRAIGIIRRRGPWAPRPDPSELEDAAFDPATTHVPRAQDRAVRRYHWHPLDVPVTFLCSEGKPDEATIARRWRPFLHRLTVRRIRGDHTTVLTHHVGETCAAIAGALENARC